MRHRPIFVFIILVAIAAFAQTFGNVATLKDASGNTVATFASGNTTITGTLTAPNYLTTTNCSANGSAANPSIVNCGSASAGHFSCDVAASGGTCHVNTTAVTLNSEIFVTDSDTPTTGVGLGVTCNNAPTGVPATLLAIQVGGSSFDINVPTITVNPACYSYFIVN